MPAPVVRWCNALHGTVDVYCFVRTALCVWRRLCYLLLDTTKILREYGKGNDNRSRGSDEGSERRKRETISVILADLFCRFSMPFMIIHAVTKAFEHILVRHEQSAAHAAEGYSRASGDVGVCIVTSGPGATNTLTGIADAMMDSTPIVVIAGQVGVDVLGTDSFRKSTLLACRSL